MSITKKVDTKLPIVLGQKYRDKIHGFEGVATAYTQYLTGCDRVALEFKDGGEIKAHWFDITLIEEVVLPKTKKEPGGPGINAPSRDPKTR